MRFWAYCLLIAIHGSRKLASVNGPELSNESVEEQLQPEPDHGKPLLVDWADSEWFRVWLKLARHESVEAAA